MIYLKSLLLPLLFGSLALPLLATQVRIATFNVLTGIGPTGDPEREALIAVLDRIDADIVGLQEVTGTDLNNGHLATLASDLGYPHLFIPETALDTGSRVILLSRFPFAPGSTTSIGSPSGANDVTRAAAAAIVDVPNTTHDPVIVTAHLKCCFEIDDPFRRAVEMIRIRKYLESIGVDQDDNIFVMGDFNLLGNDQTFTMLPGGLPSTFSLGNDISFDVSYFSDPTQYFPAFGLTNPGYRQQDGMTTDTFMGSSIILDYLLVSPAVAARRPATEIYNSRLDANFPGLPKAGPALAAGTSDLASDHYAVFGDFTLDDTASLRVTVSPHLLLEDSPPALVTVSLPAPALIATTINLQVSDASEADLGALILTIPVGAISATTSLVPKRDLIADGDQAIAVNISSSGLQGDTANVTVSDSDETFYTFFNVTSEIREDFDLFEGSQSLAAWDDQGISWVGLDDGRGLGIGARSYQGSLGFQVVTEAEFRATFFNDSGTVIDALSLSYLGQHWRRFTNGSPDAIEVSYLRGGSEQRLPELDYRPSVGGPGGPLDPPTQELRETYLRGLALQPSEGISLILRVIPGTPSASSSASVFINEFHYDNDGADEGEFVEIAVTPGFPGDLSNVELHFYNGSNGSNYGAVHALDSFLAGPNPQPGGTRYFYKEISGLQNGAPDGMALTVDGVVQEFLSYEGGFTASEGVASGLSSTPIGVSQSGSNQAGMGSLARSGVGKAASDFQWITQAGPHTKGEANIGQTFGASAQPQGLAIDDLIVTPLMDRDGDLLPDAEEIAAGTDPLTADSDRDGQSDSFELLLAGTDPLDGASYFRTHLALASDLYEVSFPSLLGRTYRVEFSADLIAWESSPPQTGTGEVLIFPFTEAETAFFRVRIERP